MVKQGKLLRLDLGLGVFGHGQVVEVDAVKLRQLFRVPVITDNQRNIASKFATVMTMQQVNQTVIVLRHHDRHACFLLRQFELPGHVKTLRDWAKRLFKIGHGDIEIAQIPFHAHQKQIIFRILMLVCV